jgi:hypothetical protein
MVFLFIGFGTLEESENGCDVLLMLCKKRNRLNECWSSEEHGKIFRAEPNHVSFCDGFGSEYSCVRF